MISTGASANQVDGDGIVKDNNGEVAMLNQEEAIEACKTHGMRMPTIRELAELYRKNGLRIFEEAEAKKIKNMQLTPIVQTDMLEEEPGTRFWTNVDNYKSPKSSLNEDVFFWSASNQKHLMYNTYVLNPDTGFILGAKRENKKQAVRCIKARPPGPKKNRSKPSKIDDAEESAK